MARRPSTKVPWYTEVIGWFGVLAILLAYTLLNFGRLDSHNTWYQILNLAGSVALIVNCGIKKDSEPLFLNIVWAIVALLSLVRLLVPLPIHI
jgi:hypothetical protein